jgi:tRNA (guanine37-N1)-methyltransferase
MKFTIFTLFPEIIESYFCNSIMKRAVESGLVSYSVINFREYASDKHRTCDDAPYGGGAGMVLKPEPIASALDAYNAAGKKIIVPSPSGRLFSQQTAAKLSEEQEIFFICGRYEGIDFRLIEEYKCDELCIGDYVLSSGEISSLVIIDSVYRLLEGVISRESLFEESFSDGLLEYPHYTRPEIFRNRKVPEVLLSGNHALIDKWRNEQRLIKTRQNRPELIKQRQGDEHGND